MFPLAQAVSEILPTALRLESLVYIMDLRTSQWPNNPGPLGNRNPLQHEPLLLTYTNRIKFLGHKSLYIPLC